MGLLPSTNGKLIILKICDRILKLGKKYTVHVGNSQEIINE